VRLEELLPHTSPIREEFEECNPTGSRTKSCVVQKHNLDKTRSHEAGEQWLKTSEHLTTGYLQGIV
jgi:hypothetical protein